MVTIEIEIEAQALMAKLQRKADELPDKLAEVVNQSAFDAQDILMSNAPRDLGTLAGSHRVESRGLLERVIFPDEGIAPYALFVVLGTKPHVITGNPYLAFQAKDGTSVVLGSYMRDGSRFNYMRRGIVHHPGTKPNNYIKGSVPEIQAKIRSNLDDFKQWLQS